MRASTGASTPAVPTRARSQGLDALRLVAVLGVHAIHIFAVVVTNDDIRGSRTWWAATAVDLGSVWVVPVLVMVSGALLLDPRAHGRGPGDFYRRRLLRLGPAFIAWQVFYVLVVRVWMSREQIGPRRLFELVADAETYTHLYFLWLIVGLYVIAPVLAAFLAGGGQRRALTVAALAMALTLALFAWSNLQSLAGSPRPIVLGALTQWMPYVGYFVAGWALRRVVLGRAWTAVAALVTVLLLAEVVWQYGMKPQHPLLQAVLPVSYLGAVVALASVGVFVVGLSVMHRVALPRRAAALLLLLSNASFGVFLVHFFFIVLMRQLLPGFSATLPSSLPGVVTAYLGIAVLSFAVSIAFSRVPYLRRLV